ncbi:MAG TPA: twin-arginine translocation signal domain-containing protein [Acidimicrobiia bacterium]|nr:twin-arginine translocation signal domain-containing protein [Acidimicrobiia bacterium]
MSRTLVRRVTEMVDRPVSRRGFLRRLTMGATALTVAPLFYVTRPVTAHAAICSCSGSSCDCGNLCCDGYTEFCCSIYGENTCPAGTIPAGWWKADGSGVCDNEQGPQPRYYLDCNISTCGSCGCGGSGTCAGGCQEGTNFTCGCANGDCHLRKSSCTRFRYGQCNQHVSCVGPIVCRVVTCTPPWIWDASCTTASATDNNTRFHNAACLNQPGLPSALPSGVPVSGDWTGAGRDMPGVFANGLWHLRPAGGGDTIVFEFGGPGDRPVVGDWNGDGVDTPGVYRNGIFYLRNSNSTGVADIAFAYGNPGDSPLAGDWTGKGFDSIGVHRAGTWLLRNSNSSGPADIGFDYGNPTDRPLVGDWDGDGVDTPGLYRHDSWYLRNSNTTGVANLTFVFGDPGDTAVTGDWDGTGTDTPGIVRTRRFYLRNSNSSGPADEVI